MCKKILSLVIVLAVSFSVTPAITVAAVPFYENKTIHLIVGNSAGGGFDTYARAIARHVGKYIPGNPTIVVENVPAAAGMMAANSLFKVSKPDGLTLGHFLGSLFLRQAFNMEGVEFNAPRFEFIGAPFKTYPVCVLTKASGIASIDKWMNAKVPVKLGGQMPLADPDNIIRILRAAVGLPIQLVSGYKGTPDIRLAAEGGEISGAAWGWESLKVTWRKALVSGDIVPLVQVVPKALPDLPNVPLAINLAKTAEGRHLIESLHNTSAFMRPFVMPPGTPKDRVDLMRKAFLETLKDKEFLAETEKAQLGIEPVSGDELEKAVVGIFKTDAASSARFKEALLK